MNRLNDIKLKTRFTLAIEPMLSKEDNITVKVAYGLVIFRGRVKCKTKRLKIVEMALQVMDEVLGPGKRRIAPNQR